jgi:hypothetical protein
MQGLLAEINVSIQIEENGMNNEFSEKIGAVRDCWSSQEKQSRAQLAKVMQLQLRSIFVLAELCRRRQGTKGKETTVIANAT